MALWTLTPCSTRHTIQIVLGGTSLQSMVAWTIWMQFQVLQQRFAG